MLGMQLPLGQFEPQFYTFISSIVILCIDGEDDSKYGKQVSAEKWSPVVGQAEAEVKELFSV
jgi:hypothetical protein